MIKQSLIKKQFVKIDPGREEAGYGAADAGFWQRNSAARFANVKKCEVI